MSGDGTRGREGTDAAERRDAKAEFRRSPGGARTKGTDDYSVTHRIGRGIRAPPASRIERSQSGARKHGAEDRGGDRMVMGLLATRRTHLHLWRHCLPAMFRTRQGGARMGERHYGYIRHRRDLRSPPHEWRMPARCASPSSGPPPDLPHPTTATASRRSRRSRQWWDDLASLPGPLDLDRHRHAEDAAQGPDDVPRRPDRVGAGGERLPVGRDPAAPDDVPFVAAWRGRRRCGAGS